MRVLMLMLLAGCATTSTPVANPEPTPSLERPIPGEPPVFTPAVPEVGSLPNGTPVHVLADPTLPLVSLRLTIPTGSAFDPPGQYGMAAMSAAMLGESAGDRTSLEQAAALSGLAADLNFRMGRDTFWMSLDCHRDRFAEALKLAADALLRPALAEADWNRVREQHLNGVKAAMDDNRSVAGVVAARQFWGAAHPYGTPHDGTVETAEVVALQQVADWLDAQVHAGGATWVVVGDVDVVGVTKQLEAAFGAWEAKPRAAREFPAAAGEAGLVIVDRPGSTQTVFDLVHAGQVASEPNRGPLDVARVIMGGSFTSRLNNRLREQLGFTYGARMYVNRRTHGGTVSSGASIRADATADALVEFRSLWGAAAETGFTEAEVSKGRSQLLSGMAGRAETRASLANLYAGEVSLGRDPAGIGAYLKTLPGVDKAAADAVAKEYLVADDAVIVLVGDLAAIEGPLREKGVDGWRVAGTDGLTVD